MNSTKGDYIFGHLFGAIGVLAGTPAKRFYLPLFMNLQDGVKTIWNWNTSAEPEPASHVVQMIEQGFAAARTFGSALLFLDRYFLSISVLTRWKQGQASNQARLDLVTKTKTNAIAYEPPAFKKPGRGRPPKKGKKVKLKELFQR